MAQIALDAVAVTSAPASVDFTAQVANAGRPCEIRLANESPFDMRIVIGSDRHWLPRGVADVFPLRGGATRYAYQPTSLANLGGAPSSSLLATVATEPDRIAGTYPAPLSRQQAVTAPPQVLGSFGVGGNGGSNSGTFVAPAGTKGIIVSFSIGAQNLTQCQLTGTTTNQAYYFQNPSVDQVPFYIFPIPGGEASWKVDVTTAIGAPGVTITVAALLDPAAMVIANAFGLSALPVKPGGVGTVWDVSDRAGRLLGVIASIAAAVDVSDRAGRLLGIVNSITQPVDVSDRAARLVGQVSPTATSAWDVSDRGGRVLGSTNADVTDRAARVLGLINGVPIEQFGDNSAYAAVVAPPAAGLIVTEGTVFGAGFWVDVAIWLGYGGVADVLDNMYLFAYGTDFGNLPVDPVVNKIQGPFTYRRIPTSQFGTAQIRARLAGGAGSVFRAWIRVVQVA